MIYRSKAPLRLGLAGGGTDVSPYSDLYGGAILNTTISMFAYASIEEREDGKIKINSMDRKESFIIDSVEEIRDGERFELFTGVYNRIVKEFAKKPLSFTLTTYVDAPPGSGLGSSSTLVVAILGAFVEWLNLPLGDYDIANLAYEIERIDLGFEGGKQDHYAATFGGFNFMEFYDNNKVIVNPLRIKPNVINELQFNTVLYFTGMSRVSSDIIKSQISNVKKHNKKSIEAMHNLKKQAVMMKEAILKGELYKIGEILDYGWRYKKKMSNKISNKRLEEIYEVAKKAGATGGKISGAGGGGFMIFYCPGNARYRVIETLEKEFGGEFRRFKFTKYGLETWRI